MEIIRAKVYGYCMGVERAIKKTFHELEIHSTKKIVTLGPLIHNPHTLAKLSEKGAAVIKKPEDILDPENTIVIIRAHGVPPQLEKDISARGAVLIDATCPKVHLSQKKAQAYWNSGYKVIIVGEKEHSEMTGILGYAPEAVIVKDLEEAVNEAKHIAENCGVMTKTVLLAQTTYSESRFEMIVSALRDILPSLEVEYTICKATKERQEALYELCKIVDAVLVIGGKESANTKRLKTLAEEQGVPTWLIENEREIPQEIYQFDRVGLTAGASTPAEVIDTIETVLRTS